MDHLSLRLETQQSPVADEVSAITSVVRPILTGLLLAQKADIVNEAGGHEKLKLKMLPRVYREGDGDCGICFEYAVHSAVLHKDPMVLERVHDALAKHCKLPGEAPSSMLFAAEKAGVNQLVDTSLALLTADSQLMYGTQGRPVKLKKHLRNVADAFRKRKNPPNLPQSIAGLWKADLFLGMSDLDKWVGTSVKINPSQLESARGLRVGIVPSKQGASDLPYKDDSKNMIVCPLKHDGDFMEVFYSGWQVIRSFLKADANVPKEVNLPQPALRQVARYLADRREYPVLDVVAALEDFAQPHLLATSERSADLVKTRDGQVEVSTVVAPVPKSV
ncbi:hypothetical protein LX16_2274 [Stackebrandtia albiflava]|uniref:Uncharacterized protein n=1 Tax=Stackebrandtia albiflava TaxID=406432 RepID=A0A562V0X3_9ACTN|nr:hypothetical protein LX16_2274 [Stackebrandtia albiflava]